jgi:hypothetical protein
MEYEPKQPVYLPTADYLQLDLFLMETRPGVKPDAFVTELVKRWLALEAERLSLRKNGQALRGFQWKDVFLPEGTHLRTSYRETCEFAKVVGNQIVSDEGKLLTPSQFANLHADGRNAWRFVWLRFPGDDFWGRADNYRTRFDQLQRRRSKAKMAASNEV